jgi:hypothetical protein
MCIPEHTCSLKLHVDPLFAPGPKAQAIFQVLRLRGFEILELWGKNLVPGLESQLDIFIYSRHPVVNSRVRAAQSAGELNEM